jgi:hypothetical protein
MDLSKPMKKKDKGGYVKHPVRGPDVFVNKKKKKPSNL